MSEKQTLNDLVSLDVDNPPRERAKRHDEPVQPAEPELIEQKTEHSNPTQPDEPAQPVQQSLAERAAHVLAANDRGFYTAPAGDLYPHQWLWDSCFTAIGLRHLDTNRAQSELSSLIRGQWSNGMIPNIIFSSAPEYHTDRNYWRSWINPLSPDGLATSGITQPPMLAEAVWQVGQSLKAADRRSWFKYMLRPLVRYHEWLYNDRDPHHEGLVLLVHPWETGLDNTPPWMAELHEHKLRHWIRFLEKTHLYRLVGLFRRDTQSIPIGQRFSTIEVLALFDAQRRLRRKNYDTLKIIDHGLFSIEDLTFNCIFIRANTRLREIAEYTKTELPQGLLDNMKRTEKALEELWDPYAGQYWSREFVNHLSLKQPSIATLMPLYAGCITKDRAKAIVGLLENPNIFAANYAVPSVPLDSPEFDPNRYWQGPTWVNTNWLIIEGLRQYGFDAHADALTESTIEMVDKSGCYEYFNPVDGAPLGAANFAWTAALTLDLLHR